MIVLKEVFSDIGDNPLCGEKRLDLTVLLTYWQLQDLWISFRVAIQYRIFYHPVNNGAYYIRGFKAGTLNNENYKNLIEVTIYLQDYNSSVFVGPVQTVIDNSNDGGRRPMFVDIVLRLNKTIPQSFEKNTLTLNGYHSDMHFFRISTDPGGGRNYKISPSSGQDYAHTLGFLKSINGEEVFNAQNRYFKELSYSGFSITIDSVVKPSLINNGDLGIGVMFYDYGSSTQIGAMRDESKWSPLYYKALPVGMIGNDLNIRDYVNSFTKTSHNVLFLPQMFLRVLNAPYKRCSYNYPYVNYERVYKLDSIDSGDNYELSLNLLPMIDILNFTIPEMNYMCGSQTATATFSSIVNGRYIYDMETTKVKINNIEYSTVYLLAPSASQQFVYDNGAQLSYSSTGWQKYSNHQLSLYSKPAGTIQYTTSSGNLYFAGSKNSYGEHYCPRGRYINTSYEKPMPGLPAGNYVGFTPGLITSMSGETMQLSHIYSYTYSYLSSTNRGYYQLETDTATAIPGTYVHGGYFQSNSNSIDWNTRKYITGMFVTYDSTTENIVYGNLFYSGFPTLLELDTMRNYVFFKHPHKDRLFLDRMLNKDIFTLGNNMDAWDTVRDLSLLDTNNVLIALQKTGTNDFIQCLAVNQIVHMTGILNPWGDYNYGERFGGRCYFRAYWHGSSPLINYSKAPYYKIIESEPEYSSIRTLHYRARSTTGTISSALPDYVQKFFIENERYETKVYTTSQVESKAAPKDYYSTYRFLCTTPNTYEKYTKEQTINSIEQNITRAKKTVSFKMINPRGGYFDLGMNTYETAYLVWRVYGYSLDPLTRDAVYTVIG